MLLPLIATTTLASFGDPKGTVMTLGPDAILTEDTEGQSFIDASNPDLIAKNFKEGNFDLKMDSPSRLIPDDLHPEGPQWFSTDADGETFRKMVEDHLESAENRDQFNTGFEAIGKELDLYPKAMEALKIPYSTRKEYDAIFIDGKIRQASADMQQFAGDQKTKATGLRFLHADFLIDSHIKSKFAEKYGTEPQTINFWIPLDDEVKNWNLCFAKVKSKHIRRAKFLSDSFLQSLDFLKDVNAYGATAEEFAIKNLYSKPMKLGDAIVFKSSIDENDLLSENHEKELFLHGAYLDPKADINFIRRSLEIRYFVFKKNENYQSPVDQIMLPILQAIKAEILRLEALLSLHKRATDEEEKRDDLMDSPRKDVKAIFEED